MSEIQEINLNKFEVKLSDTDDPVALKVSWNPKNPGGANFKSQKMTMTSDKIIIENTVGAKLFALVFAIPGLVALFVGSPYLLYNDQIIFGAFMMVWGGVFGGVGVLLLKYNKKFTIDKFNGSYYIGKEFDNSNAQHRLRQGFIKDIYAIQLINERVRLNSSNGRSSSYTSHELNLVFNDGERINIMDHGRENDIDESAIKLAEFLAVPIWKAQY